MIPINTIQTLLNDPSIQISENVQTLWSGYGQIVRVKSVNTGRCYIVKWVSPQQASSHPRGWNTSTSHTRKIQSYQIEAYFYQHYSKLTDENCCTPQLVGCEADENSLLLIMDDLDELGFSIRREEASWQQLQGTIKWLAHFHAKFMGCSTQGLWPVGSYWHLATRQDEWQAMSNSPRDKPFKQHAQRIDDTLNNAKFKSLIHGDAKLANFCFSPNSSNVAAVDFQYVGGGAGVKDLAYLVGSAFDNQGLQNYGSLVLDEYIVQLKAALCYYSNDANQRELEQEIRFLYPVAWADFYRFLLGWNPHSWKMCEYMAHMARVGLARLD